MTARKPRLVYLPVAKKLTEFTLPRLLPARLVDRMSAKMLGIKQTSQQ